MKPGSVIVDLAAQNGGNCELTESNEKVIRHGVTIIGYTDLPSRMAAQSSQLYGTNLRHLLTDMCPEKDGNLVVDFDDEVVRGATVVKDGEITWPPPEPKLSAAPPPQPQPVAAPEPVEEAQPGDEICDFGHIEEAAERRHLYRNPGEGARVAHEPYLPVLAEQHGHVFPLDPVFVVAPSDLRSQP